MDPHLALDEDMGLKVTCTKPGEDDCYGSQKDEAAAMKALSAIELKDQQLKDTLLTHLLSKHDNLSEVSTLHSLVCCSFYIKMIMCNTSIYIATIVLSNDYVVQLSNSLAYSFSF